MTSKNKTQLAKLDQEQERINRTYDFLQVLYKRTKNDYHNVSVSEYLSKNSLPYTTIQIIVNLNYVKTAGTNATKKYLWSASTEPNLHMAEKVCQQARELVNKYARNKFAENKNPKTLHIGHKHFVKVIDKKEKKEKPKYPVTVTEINIQSQLKLIKYYLTQHGNTMDFSALCERKAINVHTEKAMLMTVVEQSKSGYHWIGGDNITYEMIRNVIDVKKEIAAGNYEPLIKKEESVNVPEYKLDLNESDDLQTRIFKCIQHISHDIKIQQVKGISYYYGLHNVPSCISVVMKNLKIIDKNDKGGYVWLGQEPTDEMSNQIQDAIRAYYTLNANKKRGTVGVVTRKYNKTAKLAPQIDTPENIKEPILNTIVKEVIKDQQTNIALLAEKFAKIGNYKMAEELLDKLI